MRRRYRALAGLDHVLQAVNGQIHVGTNIGWS